MTGGLIQLMNNCMGGSCCAKHPWCNISEGYPSNFRESIQYWFINDENGKPKKENFFRNIVDDNLIERYRLERCVLPKLKEYIIPDLSEIVIDYVIKK